MHLLVEGTTLSWRLTKFAATKFDQSASTHYATDLSRAHNPFKIKMNGISLLFCNILDRQGQCILFHHLRQNRKCRIASPLLPLPPPPTCSCLHCLFCPCHMPHCVHCWQRNRTTITPSLGKLSPQMDSILPKISIDGGSTSLPMAKVMMYPWTCCLGNFRHLPNDQAGSVDRSQSSTEKYHALSQLFSSLLSWYSYNL